VYDTGGVVNHATVAHELTRHNELNSCGGYDYLVDLDTNMPVLFDLDTPIRNLKELAALRRVIFVTQNIQRRCFAREPVQEILDSASELLFGAGACPEHAGPVFAKQVIDQVGVNQLLTPRRERGIRLPWPALDSHLAGLHPGELTAIAAHTSGGKTSMALQIAMHAAAQNVRVLVFSLEMGKEDLLRRMIRQRSGVNDFDNPDSEERERVREAANWIYDAPIAFDESAMTVPAMHASIRKLKHEEIGLVVVDYLQLVRGVGRYENRAKEVGSNSRALKLAAREFRIPFIMLSQLSRESAKAGRLPELYDLKESGDIENDCDNVLFIHPSSDSEDDLTPVDVLVAKQREGPRGLSVQMFFKRTCQRFEGRDEEGPTG
jgi:replicative DNA helicase